MLLSPILFLYPLKVSNKYSKELVSEQDPLHYCCFKKGTAEWNPPVVSRGVRSSPGRGCVFHFIFLPIFFFFLPFKKWNKKLLVLALVRSLRFTPQKKFRTMNFLFYSKENKNMVTQRDIHEQTPEVPEAPEGTQQAALVTISLLSSSSQERQKKSK